MPDKDPNPDAKTALAPPDGRYFASQVAWAEANLSAEALHMLQRQWFMEARTSQYPLPLAPERWLVIGGRGSGKTRLGAEWLNGVANGLPPFASRPHGRIALVGETLGDVREVMLDGESGVLGLSSAIDRPRYEPSRRRLVWNNGAVAQIFSSEDPDSLRGPQFDAAWCDELAKWSHDETVWDMLAFGLRLGETPRMIVTTTPRPTRLMKRLIGGGEFVVTRMRTEENEDHLAPGFLNAVRDRYGGTRLGRQELDGELIEERADALWSRDALDEIVDASLPPMQRIVVAVDPPAGASKRSDACGIVAAGQDGADGFWVLADATVQGLKPDDWARRAAELFHALEADALVVEVNQGGAMVQSVINAVDPSVPVTSVHATRGKYLRAEPIVTLYAQGRVRHAGRFAELVDEMADFGPNGLTGGRSPDRVDALVWALTALKDGAAHKPRIRNV